MKKIITILTIILAVCFIWLACHTANKRQKQAFIEYENMLEAEDCRAYEPSDINDEICKELEWERFYTDEDIKN